jgi:enamine deaminase RidA (YjgF/YER057c/UK114 family)
MTREGLTCRPIDAAETHPLRHAVLHPDRTGDGLVIAGDHDPAALHVGAFLGDDLIGVGSLFPEALPESSLGGTWRIVGMAVRPDLRGKGIGAAMLECLMAHAAGHGAKLAWCNSREAAVSLYRRFGFTSTPPHDLGNHEGPRVRMTCRVERTAPVARASQVTEGGVLRNGVYPRLSRATVFKDTVHIGGLLPNRSDIPVGEQTREVLEKIDTLLAGVGSSKTRLISATVWLKDIATVAEANDVWEAWVPAGYAPARSCVQAVPGSPDYGVEIAVMAAL